MLALLLVALFSVTAGLALGSVLMHAALQLVHVAGRERVQRLEAHRTATAEVVELQPARRERRAA